MSERELKFHVPASSRTALLQAISALAPSEHQLQACYYDTPERDLAKARVALRLRKEDDQWVQTTKAPGEDAVSRLEFNQSRPDNTLDLTAFKDTPLRKTLAAHKERLRPTYETDVTRLAVRVRQQNSVIELAHDQGVLRSGGVELEIHELELELVSGNISDLFRLAEHWQQEYGLILELRSKAERGDTLGALVQQEGEPDLSSMIRVRRAGNIRYDAAHDLNSAFRVCVDDCLQQIIRNAAGLAGIDSELNTHAQRISLVHQLRVGVRRLRSCWKLFKPWIADEASPEAAELRRYFSLFGEGRDHDVMLHEITPIMLEAGMPQPVFPLTDMEDPMRSRNLAASAGLQTILLKLLEQSLTAPAVSKEKTKARKGKGKEGKPPAATMVQRLNKWLSEAVQAGEHFSDLSPEERHELRKKVKRLRYSFEFSQTLVQALLPPEVRTLLLAIQRALGDLNDLYTAEAFYQQLPAEHPSTWFALGWIRASQRGLADRITVQFTYLAQVGPLKP